MDEYDIFCRAVLPLRFYNEYALILVVPHFCCMPHYTLPEAQLTHLIVCTNNEVHFHMVYCVMLVRIRSQRNDSKAMIYSTYSSPCLVAERTKKLNVKAVLVESGWCLNERWSNLPLLCMVSFGQRRILGTTGKDQPYPPLHPATADRLPKPVEV